MPLSFREEIEIYISELEKLITFSKSIEFPKRYISKLIQRLDKLELMILDSAFKGLDLVKLNDTILVLPDKYLQMLQNVTVCLLLELKRFILSR